MQIKTSVFFQDFFPEQLTHPPINLFSPKVFTCLIKEIIVSEWSNMAYKHQNTKSETGMLTKSYSGRILTEKRKYLNTNKVSFSNYKFGLSDIAMKLTMLTMMMMMKMKIVLMMMMMTMVRVND